MRRVPTLCGVALLSIAIVSCGGDADNDAVENDVATTAPAAEEPVGTAGQAPSPDESRAAPDGPLPDTASPLPLIGGLGALLVGGAFALRRYVGR